MKRLFLTVVLALTVAGLLSCSGGGASSGGGTSSVTIGVGSSSQAAFHKAESKSLFAKAVNFFKFMLPGDAVAASSLIPSNVKTIVFTITGANMTTITKEVSTAGKTQIVETFDVPNGSGRTFTVEAKTACGSVVYTGTETADINGTVSIGITLADSINKFYYDIASLISASTGSYETGAAFGTESSTQVSQSGIITITGGEGESSITMDVPCEFRNSAVMELQVNYVDGGSARFTIRDDQNNEVANSDLEGDDSDHNTYTWQIAVPDTETLTIATNSTVTLNAYVSFIPLNHVNNSGVYLADIRQGSSRINTALTTADISDWGGGTNCISAPANFWNCSDEESADLVFDISEIVSDMTQPVLEINFGRQEDSSSTITLLDDEGNTIGSYFSDDEDDEEMGQTFTVDITARKGSSYFKIANDCNSFINPFVKIYDAASTSGKAVMLDVQAEGSRHSSHSGDIDFYQTSDDYDNLFNSREDSDLEYRAPHWMATDSEGDSTLVLSVPEAAANFTNPVLEIMHFAPESDITNMEFYLLDEDDNEIAHIFFDQMDCDFSHGCGGALKNQIPLGAFKNSSSLKIMVPGGSIAAFPGFIKIFDAEQDLMVSANRADAFGCSYPFEDGTVTLTASGGTPPYTWSTSDSSGNLTVLNALQAQWFDAEDFWCEGAGDDVTVTVTDAAGNTATDSFTVNLD